MMGRPVSTALMAAVLACAATPAAATRLDEQMAAFAKAPDSQPEAAVTAILQTALAERRSAEAMAKMQPWFARNLPKAQATLFYAGRVAEFAARCRESLRLAGESLERAERLVQGNLGEELIAAEVRVALSELGKVVGAVYTDDVLDRIFSRFCIGK